MGNRRRSDVSRHRLPPSSASLLQPRKGARHAWGTNSREAGIMRMIV